MKRRNFIGKLSLATAVFAVPATAYSFQKNENYKPVKTSFALNPDFAPVPGTEDYPGNPLDQRGLFMNEEHVFWPSMWDVIKWKLSPNPYKEEKKHVTGRLKVIEPASADELPDNSITWLGHASYLMHLGGKRILIDPVITKPGFFLKRYSELPFETSQFVNIDYILISHNHRDHCDKGSIELLARQNPHTTWLCGLRLDTLLLKDWTGSDRIQAAGWYQQYQIEGDHLKISFLPTRHWSRRGLSDTNASLWGAFMLEHDGKKIYFGSDSGYAGHVKKAYELFGEVDHYIAGIGAFAPRWFMAPSHMHPEEVAQTCNELHAKNLIPMHFGTFDLSDEPLLEPARLIQQLKHQNAFDADLSLLAVGGTVNI